MTVSTTTSSAYLGGGSPQRVGNAATDLVGFWGTTAITQPTNAAQAALTLTTGLTGGLGFTTLTAFNAFTAQLENIRASLVLMGLLKGS